MKRMNSHVKTNGKKHSFNINDALQTLQKTTVVFQSLEEVLSNYILENMEISFPEQGIDFYEATELYRVNLIKQALRRTDGNQSEAAKLLRLKPTTLHSIIKKYGIKV